MGYLDYTDAWLRDLTRQRRAERKVQIEAQRTEPIRFAGASLEFHRNINEDGGVSRARNAARSWRRRMWKLGVRTCFYCLDALSWKIGDPKKATVDHRRPLAQGGRDDASNWAMCCLDCNNRKGMLTEAEYRALLGAARMIPAERAN